MMADQRLTPQDEETIRARNRMSFEVISQGPADDAQFWATYANELEADTTKLLAEIDRLRGERQWQPIETAPKDASDVLISGDGVMAFGYWNGERWVTPIPNQVARPSHWMPLPAAPDATVPPPCTPTKSAP